MRLKVFTTGGTIDKIYFDAKSEFQVGDPQIRELLSEAHVDFDYDVTSLMRKDSLDLTDADRELIRRSIEAEPSARVLVTHGTDTMVETARELCHLADKTIVLTGSLQPMRFRVSDGVFNIAFAIGVVQFLPPGVYIAMHGRVFDPLRTRKNRQRSRFEELA